MSFHVPPKKTHALPIFHPSGERVAVEGLNPAASASQADERGHTQTAVAAAFVDGPPSEPAAPAPAPAATPSASVSAPNATHPPIQPGQHHGNEISTASSLPPREHITQTPAANNGSWTPDLYAPSYVPQYLVDINNSPAVDCHSKPLKTMDFMVYVRNFAGSEVLKPVPAMRMPEIREVSISLSRHATSLSPSVYKRYFDECLMAEAHTGAVELSRLALYDVRLRLYRSDQQIYKLSVPGLKDDAPRVELGDIVLVRQIVPAGSGSQWPVAAGGANGFTGHQHHAVVWGISRAKQTVLLRIDRCQPQFTQCNVTFQVQANRFVPLWTAVSRVHDGPSWKGPGAPKFAGGVEDNASWMRHMLFPEWPDGSIQRHLPRGSFPHTWVDPALNAEQMKAVDAVVSQNFGNLPFLISGVPGSGKTKTLVECALQLLKSSEVADPHILICAPSKPAADTLAMRLREHLTPGELFRLNSYTRSFAEVPDVLMQYTYTEGETFSLPKFSTMMKYKVIVMTCTDADMLVHARLTNTDLMKLAYETVSSVTRGIPFNPEQALHWTALIVDEAAQATEPSVCVPLTVVANPLPIEQSLSNDGEKKTSLPVVVMAGDQHQLGPHVSNSDTALDISLFERLSSRSVYSEHPLSRRNAGPRKPLTQSMLPIQRPPFTNLVRNYRSHQAILAVPSILFYSDTLLPSAPPIDPAGPVPSWPGWKSPQGWPVLFSCNTSADSVEEILHGPAGTGLYNHGEALKALHHAQSLLQHSGRLHAGSYLQANSPLGRTPPLRLEEIAIITPFNSQVAHLRQLFRAHGLAAINIGPLEAFQGLESRFLIICTTRTRTDPRFVAQDQSLGLGLIGERKRFNVALTRAREGVVVIGNPVLLGGGRPARDEVWRAFLSFCARNGCWEPESVGTNAQDRIHTDSGVGDVDDGGGGDGYEASQSAAYWERKLAGLPTCERASADSTATTTATTTATASTSTSTPSDEETERGGDRDRDPRLEGYVSSLEYGLLYGAKVREAGGDESAEGGHAQLGDEYDSAMWVSGTAAEEVLRGWE